MWQGIGHVLDFGGHPAAGGYVWSSPIEGSDKRRIFAVLHLPPIESVADAVPAAIVTECRAKKSAISSES